MNRIEYLVPRSWSEAAEMMSAHPGIAPLAGGTDILVQMKAKQRSFTTLMSLKQIPEAHQLTYDNEALTLGAAVTAGQIARDERVMADFTALAMGANLIGSIQIRNMATVGGNLCNAAPSADTAPPLLVFRAQAVIRNKSGERVVPLEEFFVGPGQTVLEPSEILTSVIVPRLPANSGSFYLRHTPRAWMDIAVVGAAAAITIAPDDTVSDVCLALGAVAPTPIRAVRAESLLRGQALTEDSLQEAGRIAAQEAQPIDDLRASAEFREHLVSVLVQRALRGALANARRIGEPTHG